VCVYTVQTVGDAVADMLAVELILAYRDWSVETWNEQYTDLPNRQTKIHVSLSICLSVCLSVCMSVYLCLSCFLSVCLPVCLSERELSRTSQMSSSIFCQPSAMFN